jgi:formylmethanofuran dehydrogenase subunit C
VPSIWPSVSQEAVIWQLLGRDLAQHGGPFAQLPRRRVRRHLGDLAAAGKGELLLVD